MPKEQDKKSGLYDDNKPGWRTSLVDESEDDDTEVEENEDVDSEPAKKKLSSEEIEDLEENPQDSSQEESDDEENQFVYKNEKGSAFGSLFKRSSRKKLLLAVIPVVAVLTVALSILSFFGDLKAIHFATVLRGTGFASSQLVMRSMFADNAFNIAVLSDDSVGTLDRPARTMLDRLRGINTEKVMKDLGREDAFKIITDKKGKSIGFEVQGNRYLHDDVAKELFGKEFKDASFRERLTIKNQILQNASDAMADSLGAESRSFQNSFFKGFREYFNIRTSKWAIKARDFAGKSPKEALQLEREQSLNNVESGDKVPIPKTEEEATRNHERAKANREGSGIDDIDKVAQGTDDAIVNDVKKGLNLRTKEWVNTSLTERGIDIGKLNDTLGKASILVFVMTIYCVARDLDKSITSMNIEKEAKAQRMAHEIQTQADQIKDGSTVAEAVSAANTTWDSHGNTPGAEKSPLYLQALGDDPNSAPKEAFEGIPTGQVAANPIHEIFTWLDGILAGGFVTKLDPTGLVDKGRNAVIGGACSVVLNPWVMGAVAGIDIIVSVVGGLSSGGLTEGLKQLIKGALVIGIGVVGGNILGEWIDKAIKNWAGADFTGVESGTDKYSAGAVATDSMNSHVGRGVAYGRKLNNDESANAKKTALLDLRRRSEEGSVYHKYLAIDNPYSLIGRASVYAPSTRDGSLAEIASAPKTLINQVGSMLRGKGMLESLLASFTLQKRVYAADGINYSVDNNFFNVDQWGWTTEELNKVRSEESYSLLQNESWVAKNVSQEESDKFEACYKPASAIGLPEECNDPNFLSSEKALHWRVSKLNSSIIDQLSDKEDEETTAPTAIDPVVTSDTSNMSCTAGTDAGVGDGYKGGSLIKIRLCKVQGITVNAAVAGNLDKMLTAAKNNGVTLSGGGFRTMASQQQLYAAHCSNGKCSPPTARPGYSNHQMGLAIDFSNCSTHGTACWQWLNSNAATYGFKNFAKEPWHWSPDGR